MGKENKKLIPGDIDALVFDLDGVITQTRKTHKKAWKKMFDHFLDEAGHSGEFSEQDYAAYVDGKPRYEGVRSFLSSRGIELPFGEENDPPGHETVCAIGNRKNYLFNRLIRDEGVEVYDDAVEKIKTWKRAGIKTAIVSSSRNCRTILEKTGIADLFEVRVDGAVSAERGLKGKPDPDIFIEAARELDARPERSIVFEDAVSGTQAGQKGFFGLVVGVARFGNSDELLKNGADICIPDFKGFDLFGDKDIADFLSYTKPMVFSESTDIFDRLSKKEPVFFLDYDGTLTPIVSRPEDAVLSDGMRDTLSELSELFSVSVVTGRDLEDVRNFIRLDNIIYSGSHGYITRGPDGLEMEHEKSGEIMELMDKVEKDLHDLIEGKAEGVTIDRKRYAIAVHYRNASENEVPYVFKVVDKMLEKHSGLKTGEGKMLVEIKPDIDWHKGKAVMWIYKKLGFSEQSGIIPVFIGDDVTDEDAFRVLKGRGIGILVENHGQDTLADYSLKNVFQVQEFFSKLIGIYKNKKANN